MEAVAFRCISWVICWNTVLSSEWAPMLSPLRSIDDCTDCIVGTDNTRITVYCGVGDGIEPTNVTIKAGDTTLKTTNTTPGRHVAFLYLNNSVHHMANMTCDVMFDNKTQEMTTTTSIYVIIVPRTPPKLYNVPDSLPEGGKVFISCLQENTRPPANITMLINGEHVEGLTKGNDTNSSTLLYNTYVILTWFEPDWKSLQCCEYNTELETEDLRLCQQAVSVNFTTNTDKPVTGDQTSTETTMSATSDTLSEPAPVMMIVGIVGAAVLLIVIVVSTLICYKSKQSKDSRLQKTDAVPDTTELRQLQPTPGPSDTNQNVDEVQLTYVDVEFVDNVTSSNQSAVNRRELQTEYVAIDMVKTANLAKQDIDDSGTNSTSNEENIYVNQ